MGWGLCRNRADVSLSRCSRYRSYKNADWSKAAQFTSQLCHMLTMTLTESPDLSRLLFTHM